MYLLEKEIQEKRKKKTYRKTFNYEKVLFENDFFIQNSIQIQFKLLKIDYHFYHFHCFHDISNGTLLNEGKPIINSKSYIFMNFMKTNKIPLLQYLTKKNDSNSYIKNLILTYQKILLSLQKINKIGICYFNWNKNNIFINENDEYPILSNFECSIDNSLVYNYEYWNKIIDKSNNDFLPIEVWFLYEINKYNYSNPDTFTTNLSSSNLEDIYIARKEEMNISYDEYISLFQNYNYKPLKEIIQTITNYISTWDNYSLSKIYLHLIEQYLRSNPYDTKYPFLPKWHSLLKKNVSLNPLKRESLFKTQIVFENILSTF